MNNNNKNLTCNILIPLNKFIIKKTSLVIGVLLFSLFACQKEKNTVIYDIASERYLSPLDDENNAGIWLLGRTNQSKDWALLSRSIEGFTYENGFEYTLEIKEIPTEGHIDQAPFKLKLVRTIRKVKKDTQDIPEKYRKSLYVE